MSNTEEFVELRPGLWRCLVCGEIYIGFLPPVRCPFCGSNGKEYMRSNLNDYNVLHATGPQLFPTILSSHLIETIKGEFYDGTFYEKLSKLYPVASPEHQMFVRLSAIEKEHLEVFERVSGLEADDYVAEEKIELNSIWPNTMPKDKTGIEEFVVLRLRHMQTREIDASKMYHNFAKIAAQQGHPLLEFIWNALTEVESSHSACLQHYFPRVFAS